MEIELFTEDPRIRRITEELEKEIVADVRALKIRAVFIDGLATDKDGFKDGFRVSRIGDEEVIVYRTLTDYCRGLLYGCALREGEWACGTLSAEYFGYMCDCARNAVPRVRTLKKLIRLLALMGYNFLGLYLEDVLKVEGEPYFGYMRGAYTSEEIKEIVDYASIFGMRVRPYLQALAHYPALRNYAHYRKFMDYDDILLLGDERTYRLLERLLRTTAREFGPGIVNIGMDEAEMVGLGKYLSKHGYNDRFEIMNRHLARTARICAKYGIEPQIWSDMFFKLAYGSYYGAIDYADGAKLRRIQIPENVTLVYWDYYKKDREGYRKMIRMHKEMTNRVAFAGGAWKWSGFAPNNRFSLEVGRRQIPIVRQEQIKDVVITGWGDCGSEASWFSNLPVLYADAEMMYGGTGEIAAMGGTACQMSGVPNQEAFRVMTGGYSFAEFMALDNANVYDASDIKVGNSGKYLFYNDPLIGTCDSLVTEETPKWYRKAAESLDRVIKEREIVQQETRRQSAPYEKLIHGTVEQEGAGHRTLQEQEGAGHRTLQEQEEGCHRTIVTHESPQTASRQPEGMYLHTFEMERELALLLIRKCDLGVRIRRAYKEGKTENKGADEAEEKTGNKGDNKATLEDLAVECRELAEKTRLFYEAFSRQWHEQNKSFGFEIQSVRFGGVMRRLADTADELDAYVDGRLDAIEELEEKQLPFAYFEEVEGLASLNMNYWAPIVSNCIQQ